MREQLDEEQGARRGAAVRRPLVQAIVTALVLVALLAGAYLLGRRAFFALVCVVVLVALFELFDGLLRNGRRVSLPLGLLAGLALLVAAYARRPALLGLVIVAAMLASFVLALRPDRGESPASDVAWTVLGVTWVGGGGAAAVSVLVLPSGLALLVALVAIVAVDDIAAYFTGTSLGRHKLAPSISAGKSWEGVVGGLAGALAGGAVVGGLIEGLGVAHGLALGLICGALAPVGDLAESLFKREVGIKDSGRLLPGHGGLLDRLDAIIFCAPAAYLYIRFAVL